MTQGQIEKATERNIPFLLKMADDNEYRVPQSDYIVLRRGPLVIVFDETDPHDAFDVLPLLNNRGSPATGGRAADIAAE